MLCYLRLFVTAATYEDFKADLKEAEVAKECRYAIFDAEYNAKDGQTRNKIILFMWFVLFVFYIFIQICACVDHVDFVDIVLLNIEFRHLSMFFLQLGTNQYSILLIL